MQLTNKSGSENQLLLTIAIPTYNRASYLDLCLARISEELDNLSEDLHRLVKVYVSNNASTDHTDKVISKYQLMKAGEFECVHNQENIGADCNIVQCYTSAKTPYVWVLGDDDVILSGGLALVLDVLRRQGVDILSIACKGYVDRYNEKPKTFRQRIKNSLYVFSKRGLRVIDVVEFTRHTNINLTFISSLIVRTGHCCHESFEATRGTNLSQLCWVSSLLCSGLSFGIIDNFIIAAKSNNSGGYSLVQVFGFNLQKVTNTLLKEKSKLFRIIQNGAIVNFFPSFIMLLRTHQNNYTKEKALASDLESLYGKNWRYYIFIVPLIKLPLSLARVYNFLLNALRWLFAPIFL